MTKGFIAMLGGADLLPGFQKMEPVNIEGVDYQKYIGDLVENGKGKLYLALAKGSQRSS